MFAELFQFFAGGQVTIDQQVGNFQELAILREDFNREAPITQDASFAVQKGDVACRGPGVAITLVQRHAASRGEQFGDVDSFLSCLPSQQ